MSRNRYDSPGGDPGSTEDGTLIGMPMKEHDPALGNMIGQFRVLRKHAEGGMGTIYVARHGVSGRQAAIKLLLPHFAQNKDVIARFFNEAKAAMAIQHPGVIEIFAYGNDDNGQAYIVMEFLKGESLQEHVERKGKLPSGDAIHLGIGIADVLAAAHAAGIIHRDLKPENIFVVPDPKAPRGERIKLLDFGVAKLKMSAPMTRIGDLMGTPLYMAPEQCRGAAGVDHRADLYALGCLLFRMVCGRPPFIGQSAGLVLRAQMQEPPPSPRTYAGDVPEPLERLILALLAKDPDDRPADTRQVLATLIELQKFSPARPPSGAFAHIAAPEHIGGGQDRASAGFGQRSMPLSSQMPAQLPPISAQIQAARPTMPRTLPGNTPAPQLPQRQSGHMQAQPPPGYGHYQGGMQHGGYGMQGAPTAGGSRAWILWVSLCVAAVALGAVLAHLFA